MEYKITCTDLAIQMAKEQILKRNNPATKGIRIGLRAGGCNGFSIIMEFSDEFNDKDHIFIFDGVSIGIDPKSMVYLNGIEISYEYGLMGKGFKFKIPAQKGSCSCGASINF